MAEKNSAQTNRQTYRQTNRHHENNGHLAVNQLHNFSLSTPLNTDLSAGKSFCVFGKY